MTRSCASAAWSRSIRSTSGSAKALSASRTGWCARDGAPLALAGLWAGWRDPATETVRRTFTIITTTPNEALADLHDRMPVVIDADAWDRWLDPSPSDPGELLGLLVPNEDVELDVYAVERFVNDVRRDGPELIVPLAPPLTLSGAAGLGPPV